MKGMEKEREYIIPQKIINGDVLFVVKLSNTLDSYSNTIQTTLLKQDRVQNLADITQLVETNRKPPTELGSYSKTKLLKLSYYEKDVGSSPTVGSKIKEPVYNTMSSMLSITFFYLKNTALTAKQKLLTNGNKCLQCRGSYQTNQAYTANQQNTFIWRKHVKNYAQSTYKIIDFYSNPN